MSISEHLKEHAILGIKPEGARVLSVGAGGKFSTIQAAIDYAESQDDCFTEIVDTHTDYYEAAPTVFLGLSLLSWVQGSNEPILNIGLGPVSISIAPRSRRFWLGVQGETRKYKMLWTDSDGTLLTDCERVDASISGQDLPIRFYEENPYIIKLLDAVYNEKVVIDANLVVVFQGNGQTIWHTDPSVNLDETVSKGSNFLYGVVDFSGVVISNPEGGHSFMTGAPGKSWQNKNAIELRVHNGTTLDLLSADLFSPNVQLGSAIFENLTVNQCPLGGAHLIYLITTGTLSVVKINWNIVVGHFGIVEAACLLVDASEARRISIGQITLNIDDPHNAADVVSILRGAQYCADIDIKDVVVNINSTISNGRGVILIDQDSEAGAAQTPVALSVVNASNLVINAPNVPAAKKYIYKGLAGQVATVSIANCHGGIVFNDGNDTINFVSQTLSETV